MAVHNTLGIPRRARRVAHRRRLPLVQLRPWILVTRRGGQQILIAEDRRQLRGIGRRGGAVHHDQVSHWRQLIRDALQQRQQIRVHEDQPILRVVDDVGEVLREEPQIQRVQHRPVARHAEVHLKVRRRVPAERRDAIALPHAKLLQCIGEPVDTLGPCAVGRALRPLGGVGDERSAREERGGAVERVPQREGIVHHRRDEASGGAVGRRRWCRRCCLRGSGGGECDGGGRDHLRRDAAVRAAATFVAVRVRRGGRVGSAVLLLGTPEPTEETAHDRTSCMGASGVGHDRGSGAWARRLKTTAQFHATPGSAARRDMGKLAITIPAVARPCQSPPATFRYTLTSASCCRRLSMSYQRRCGGSSNERSNVATFAA